MVDCEHRSRSDGRRSSASLNSGSMRRPVASLPSSAASHDHQQPEADDIGPCVHGACQRRRQTSPHGGARVGQVSASFYPRIASLFGLREPLLRPDLRSPRPSRAAAVKEARRAPRSGAQRPGRPRARRHPHRSRTTRQLSRQTIVTSRPPATGNAVVRRLGADLSPP